MCEAPEGFDYLNEDPLGTCYLEIAGRLAVAYGTTAPDTPERRQAIMESIADARAGGIPEGRIPRINTLALALLAMQEAET